MSFSSELKEELGTILDNSRHCRLAEIAAVFCLVGSIRQKNTGTVLQISVENKTTADTFALLLHKTFQAEADITQKRSARNLLSYEMEISGEKAGEIADALKIGKKGIMPDIAQLTEKACCRRAFLRGAFLAAGSVSDPDRFYHLEIPCRRQEIAEGLLSIMQELQLDAKLVMRQKYAVVYVKDSTGIAEALGLMGARKGLLEMENARIRREVRGNINRKVNCETANINKSARAAARQIEDILYIDTHIGLSSLPERLDEMARTRLKYPEISLGELGSYLEPPVGKSGVNHRLRQISAIAEKLRDQGGDYCD